MTSSPFERLDTPRRLLDTTPVPEGLLIGRAHVPDPAGSGRADGPTPVIIGPDEVRDISRLSPTVSTILALPDVAARLVSTSFPVVGRTADAIVESHHTLRRRDRLHLLSPIDLQVIKACGVTFVGSLLERIIEAEAAGDPSRSSSARQRVMAVIGTIDHTLQAGSPEALELLRRLRESGIPSTYLEVGLGTHAEVFTKAPVLSSVGTGELIGVRPDSAWNNPEPEIVLVIAPDGRIVGATLGNDVNLRDLEGRSPLLLGVAKDNNASCAVGPWIRLFDERFRLDGLMDTEVTLDIWGHDGHRTHGANVLRQISRSANDLVGQVMGSHHYYPDGLALFLGTMFVPTASRDGGDGGFTHVVGDEVQISNPSLGTLTNWVETTDRTPSWQVGIGALMVNLARRGLLDVGDP